MTQEPTGIKQLFQQMIPDGPSVKEGIVTSTSPLSVTLKNDTKMIYQRIRLLFQGTLQTIRSRWI